MKNRINKKLLISSLIKNKIHLGFSEKKSYKYNYIFGSQNKQYFIDINYTLIALKKVYKILFHLVGCHQNIFIIGQKSNFLHNYILKRKPSGLFFLPYNEWKPGFFTNFNIYFPHYLMHYFHKLTKSLIFNPNITTKEQEQQIKLDYSVQYLTELPDILVLLDVNDKNTVSVLNEAHRVNIPIIALVDTNCHPDILKKITYSIPMNTVSASSTFFFVEILINLFNRAIKERTMFDLRRYRSKINYHHYFEAGVTRVRKVIRKRIYWFAETYEIKRFLRKKKYNAYNKKRR